MNTKSNLYRSRKREGTLFLFQNMREGSVTLFAVADFLHSLKGVLNDPMSPQKGLCAAPMLEQMKGNYLFPEEIEGKELFTAVKRADVSTCSERAGIIWN